jgi:hypothetical protein
MTDQLASQRTMALDRIKKAWFRDQTHLTKTKTVSVALAYMGKPCLSSLSTIGCKSHSVTEANAMMGWMNNGQQLLRHHEAQASLLRSKCYSLPLTGCSAVLPNSGVCTLNHVAGLVEGIDL